MSIADKLTQIAENEQKVYNAGYEKGKAESEPAGDSHYDAFWDVYQKNGERTEYTGAFRGEGWTDETFDPKYNIIINTRQWTTVDSVFSMSKITDFDKILQKRGLVIEAHGVVNYLFNGSAVTRVTIDLGDTINTGLNFMFLSCNSLKKVEIKNFSNDYELHGWFTGCVALEDLTFTGTSKLGGKIDVSACSLLTRESLLNIVDVLRDYSGTTTSKTLSIGSTNLAKLSESELALATEKGWTVV